MTLCRISTCLLRCVFTETWFSWVFTWITLYTLLHLNGTHQKQKLCIKRSIRSFKWKARCARLLPKCCNAKMKMDACNGFAKYTLCHVTWVSSYSTNILDFRLPMRELGRYVYVICIEMIVKIIWVHRKCSIYCYQCTDWPVIEDMF